MIIKINLLRQIVILIISFLILSGCSNTNHTKTDKKILDYEETISNFPTHPIDDECLGTSMLYSSGTTGRPKGISI